MKNFVQPGDNLDCIAPHAVASGQGFLDGDEFAVASTDAAQGAPVQGVTRGVFDLPKAAGVAINRKSKAYWDNAGRVVTNAAAGNRQIGVFQLAAAAGDATARVKLHYVP